MTQLAIVKVSASGRVEKYQDYATQAEADAHVARVLEKFPQAFAAAHPGGGPQDWLCDTVAKTAIFSPLPLPPPAPVKDVVDLIVELSPQRRVALKAELAKL